MVPSNGGRFSPAKLLVLLTLLLTPFLVSGCKFEQISPTLYRGSIPGYERMKELKAMGVKTIVNLRTNSMPKRARWCRELGLNYFHIKTGVFQIPKEKEIKQFLSIVRNPEYQPVYVCCTLATDRTACYVGIYRVTEEGWTADQAYKEMQDQGLKEWWPIFCKYLKTFNIAHDVSTQLAGSGSAQTEAAVTDTPDSGAAGEATTASAPQPDGASTEPEGSKAAGTAEPAGKSGATGKSRASETAEKVGAAVAGQFAAPVSGPVARPKSRAN